VEAEIEIQKTKEWIERFILGMNICPFAGAPFLSSKIRYALYPEEDLIELLSNIEKEISTIDNASSEEIETSLIILPSIRISFDKFHDFNHVVEDLVSFMGLEDKFQVVAFHPLFRYADAEEDDPSNFTNRSPYPMLHILRQSSIESVADEALGRQISEDNYNKLQRLTVEELNKNIRLSDE